jgi:FkbM family methyltransferase
MQSIRFNFCGGSHELQLPDGEIYLTTAKDIVAGLSYPFATDGPPVQSVVDLGAHAGEFTVMAAALWLNATVHAFEPNPQILPLLHHNCKPYQNITIHEKAVGAQAGRGKFYVNNMNSVTATLLTPDEKQPNGLHWAAIDVDIVGPESILALAPDILKIDIECMESLLIFALGSAVLSITRIYVEYHLDGFRQQIHQMLSPTHELAHARSHGKDQGELMYLRRKP